MTATDTAALVAAVRDHAKANYETGGWSFVVEAMDDEQIIKAIGVVRTPAGAIKKLAPVVATMAERAGMKDEKPAKAEPKPKTPHRCKCGTCDRTCLGVYAQGHDARHVSQLKQAVIDGRLTLAQASDELAPADKLVAKLTHSLQLHEQAQAKREAAKAESDEAKAARHQAKAVRDADLAAKQAEEAKVTAKAAKPAKDAPATSAKAA